MKTVKKVLASVLLVCMVAAMLAVPAAADGVPVTEVVLSKYGLPLYPGQVYGLTAAVEPEDASDGRIVWSSSNEDVATVAENGIINAIDLGTAEITATSVDGGFTAVCTVIVADPVIHVWAFGLDRNEMSLNVGETGTLIPTVLPEDATCPSVVWMSENEDVAVVEDGVVMALSAGSTTVYGMAEDGELTDYCVVTVNGPAQEPAAPEVPVVPELPAAPAVPEVPVETLVYTPVEEPVDYSTVAVEGINISQSALGLYTGEEYYLTAAVYPENASNPYYTWSVSDPAVISVNDGLVTALNPGTANVTVTSEDGGYTASCQITVHPSPVYVEAMYISEDALGLNVGEQFTLTAAVYPENASNKNFSWSVDDPAVLSVANGLVTAIGPGSANVIVTSEEDSSKTAVCQITVYPSPIAVEGINISQSALGLYVGEEYYLSADVYPADASNPYYNWSVSDPAVISVDDGLVTAIGPGTANVTVTSEDGGHTASCQITVQTAIVSAEGIAISQKAIGLYIGEQYTLSAAVYPEGVSNPNYSWSVDDPAVVSVDNGLVTALAQGTAVVTVTAEDGGHTAGCEITVHPVAVTGVALNKDSLEFTLGGTVSETLSAVVSPDNATDKSLSWASSNPAVATVADGTVTAVAAGECVITVTSGSNSSLSDSCSVKVNPQPVVPVAVSGVSLDKTALEFTLGTSGLFYDLTATVSPSDATDKALYWSSSNEAVATVGPNGEVTPVGAGDCVITATSRDGGKQAICNVKVNPQPVATLDQVVIQNKYNASTLSFEEGEPPFQYISAALAEGQPVSYSWKSSNPAVVDVVPSGNNNSLCTLVINGVGNAVITASHAGANDGTLNVIVIDPSVPVKVDKVEITNESPIRVMVGYTDTINYEIYPDEAENHKVSWTSSNNAVASVANGIVYGNAVGKAVITVTTEDGGKTDYIEVEVIPLSIPAAGIGLNPSGVTLAIGNTQQLTATIYPANATNKGVVWSSDNQGIASVTNTGLVTAHSAGQTYIRARSADGNFTALCAVTVTSGAAGQMTVTPNTSTITAAGGIARLTARLTANGMYNVVVPNVGIQWTVNPSDAATVSANGEVTPRRTGTFTVTGRYNLNGVTYEGSCVITAAHIIIYGNNSTFSSGSNTPLYFVTNDLSANARSVRVDGYLLTHGQHCYIYDHQGHIAVALNPAYLNTLNPSVAHTIQIESTSGTAMGYFRIYGYYSTINGVKTGDENQAALWAALCLMSLAGAATILISRRKDWKA